MCNVGNVKTIDTERTCLTSHIFAVVDFAKHRPGMRRLHLRHCGNIRQYSHGSMFTPSTPQLEQLIVTTWRLGAISETIEQKWWERVKLTSGIGIVLSQQHYFRAQNYERYGTQIRYIILLSWKFYINSNEKNKSYHCCEMFVEAMLMAENHSVWLHVAVDLWMRSCFLKHAR